jgi:PEGA domain-containing protein
VAPQDKAEQDANVIAAAEAAASWARARRATWTTAPLAPPKPAREAPAPRPPREPLPPIEFETTEPAPPPPKPAPSPPKPAPPPRQPPPPAVDPHAHGADRAPRTSPPITLAPPKPPAAVPIAPAPSPPAATPPIALASSPPPIALAPSQPISIAPSYDTRDADRVARAAAPPPAVAAPHDETPDDGQRTSATTWLARVAVVAAVVGGGAFAWSYFSGASTPAPVRAPASSATTRPAPSTAPAAAAAKPDAKKGAGTLKIASTPAGAQVTVDGRPRGVTPLTVSELPAGKHDVVLKSDAGSVHRTVTIAANQTESLDEQIFSGWVTVYSPFEVTIAEGSRVMRPDDRNQFMLPPGIHELRLLNRALAYEAVLQVDVKPGEGANVRLTPPPSSLTVNAPDTSEVTIDGTRAGETPLASVSIPLGTHDIVVRRANGAERRYTITVGTKPYTLNVEF